MLRGRSEGAIFAALFFDAEWNWTGRIEHDAGIFAAGDRVVGRDGKEAAGGFVPARGGGWPEYRGAVCGTELLPDAAYNCGSTAEARWSGRGHRPGRIFWAAPGLGAACAALPKESLGDCACGGVAGPDAFAF